MKWIFTCLQISWLGEKEITRYYGRGSSCSISRQAKSRKSLQSSEKAWSPKTARSKGARNSRRSEPCLFQILQRKEEGIEFYLGLCSPWAKKILKYCAVQEWHTLFWCSLHFPTALAILHYWCVNGDIQDAAGKKSKPSSPASNPLGWKNSYKYINKMSKQLIFTEKKNI